MIALVVMQLLQALPVKIDPQVDIVVTAKPMVDTYAECLAGRCTPAQDARVTIALAEQRFREGKYLDAKQMLARAVGRNRKFEKTSPRSVAALYDAYATIAFQEGDTEVFRRAVSSQVRVLRHNLPANDEEVVYATIMIGDMWMRLKEYLSAEAAYRAAEIESEKQGQAVAALVASLRRVSLMMAVGRTEQADQILTAVERNPRAADPVIQRYAKIARAQLSANRSKGRDLAQLAADVPARPDGEPVLLFTPPMARSAAEDAKERAERFQEVAVGSDLPSGVDWADISFRVKPDGVTDDVTVTRGTAGPSQTNALVSTIKARRYAARPDGTPQDRLERYTFRGTYRVPINSRISRRWGAADTAMIDLSPMPVQNETARGVR